mmetsp:Transcript_17869/g.32296  ORF Transcript_17869/g.32296 Transcript_17869/m.32296 type:complete len:139 (+) Transcript_17869:60-476(+)
MRESTGCGIPRKIPSNITSGTFCHGITFSFFKVSRLVPEDVQNEMNYNANELEISNVLVVSNDPRQSPSEYWLRKTGVLVEPKNNMFLAVACLGLAVLVLFVKKRRILLMKGSLRPCSSRLGNLMLKRKLGYGHDHNT